MIDRVTSYRLPKYIRFVAIARVPWYYVAPFSLLTLSLQPILRLYDTADAARSSVSMSYLTSYS